MKPNSEIFNNAYDEVKQTLSVDSFANKILFDYDADGRILYVGEHFDVNASTDNTSWIITKFVRTSGKITSVLKKKGAWDDRTTLF